MGNYLSGVSNGGKGLVEVTKLYCYLHYDEIDEQADFFIVRAISMS